MMVMTGHKTITSFRFNGKDVEGFFLNIGGNDSTQEMSIKWCPKSEPICCIIPDANIITRIVFHLFNFADFVGTRRSFEITETIKYIDLSSDHWKVEIKSLPQTKENFKTLKENGGYQLTHIGSLERRDEKVFKLEEAEEILHSLRFFLSFAKGAWCEPVCPIGFDESGSRVWESWSSPREPWFTSISWFDPQTSSNLSNLFPGYMERWTNDDWRQTMHEVIYWYLAANNSSRGIDAGIILTQTAIERLSYQFVVNDKRLLTAKGFKDLWASDKFRLLFSSLGLPLDIPQETAELKKLATQNDFKWLDAPHALAEVRNSLVHPEHKSRGKFGSIYVEVWSLGLWYLELAILRICDYSDFYVNRLKKPNIARIDSVPWKIK